MAGAPQLLGGPRGQRRGYARVPDGLVGACGAVEAARPGQDRRCGQIICSGMAAGTMHPLHLGDRQ
ncbi:hypothetical protein Snoj_34990 [Streptomyces nojiriensis]|uniref:Uncharacterized protein n=1 Tax=Streptomyces nojiriensis TaxID=66374 RepID=A0ABQ3SN65_9ACTN|nr:hypothetical protein Snoj_34990 [Streptomyces nojiriensis]